MRVVDLGCWPGGFLQVAGEILGSRGVIVGVDRVAVEPPLKNANTIALRLELEDPELCERVLEPLGGLRADLVLCDAAPKLTGVRDVDRAAEERLLQAVEGLLPGLLRPGGDLLLKVLEGPEAREVVRRIGGAFGQAKTTRLAATRKGSRESYLVARGFGPSGAG